MRPSTSPQPPGKQTVGDRRVYAIKSDTGESDNYKAQLIAKGHSQKEGTDYEETFSPTADMTSLRVIMQKAAEEDLVLHQMGLLACTNCEIYIDQT